MKLIALLALALAGCDLNDGKIHEGDSFFNDRLMQCRICLKKTCTGISDTSIVHTTACGVYQ